MSLVVWLPLTKDLRQQGLSNVTVTNSGATYSSTGGKLGGCYIFDGVDDAITVGNLSTLVTDNFSFTCWFYHDDTWSSKNYETIFGGPSGFELEAKSGSTNSPVIRAYSWGQGTFTYELNKWNHLVMTRTTSETKFYLNGELKLTGTAGTIPSGNYFVGSWSSTTGQNFKGKVNDVRIYDHCLSLMEVKELAKGLVLHYPLSDKNIESTTNLVTGLTAGGQTIINGTTAQTKGESNADTYFYIKTSALTSGATYSLSCYVTGLESGKYWSFGIGAQSGNNKCCSFILYNGYNSCTFTLPSGLANTTQLIWDDDTYTINRATTIMKVSGIQLEQKDHSTAFTPFGTTRISSIGYDCSGYCNNGVQVGTLSCSLDTPRYNASTHFNGSSAIKNNTFSFSSNQWTASFWYKFTTAPSAYQGFLCLSRNAGGDADKKIAAMPNSNYIWIKFESINYTLSSLKVNEWCHIVLTCDGNVGKVYENGTLKYTTGSVGSILTNCDDFVVGARANSADAATTAVYLNGNMSDVRIYATALSAEDVLELYHTAARIDNIGNTYVYQYIET